MTYEPGMSVVYDAIGKGVLISFRGDVVHLHGPFPNQRAAVTAAEEYCKAHGWQSIQAANTGV